MKRFSENTLQILQEAGWYPGRLVPTDEFETYIRTECEDEEDGDAIILYPNETVRNFLSEFGGLTLKIRRMTPLSPDAKWSVGRMREIPIGVPGSQVFTVLDEEEELIGDKLYPISNDNAMLFVLMSFSGKIYGYCCGDFLDMADNAEDWIEEVCWAHSGIPRIGSPTIRSSIIIKKSS